MREINSEEWRDVPNFEGFYQANTNGDIRSLDRYVNHYSGGKCFKKGKILKGATSRKGYTMVRLTINGNGRLRSVHRIIAETFIKNDEKLPQVNHINGIKGDNRVENLEWITNIENMRHSFRNGTHKGSMLGKKGELHPRTLLSMIDVEDIKKHIEKGGTINEVATKYKVSYRTITRAIKKHGKH